MEKFHNKYRIGTTRLQSWDYSRNGTYFVTICTMGMNHYFGEIAGGEMNLSQIGEMAQDCWVHIPVHFPFVELRAFVVMPNHVHGVLIINKPVEAQNLAPKTTQNVSSVVEAQNLAPLHQPNKFGPQSQNLASVIRGFKIGVTKFAKSNKIQFSWQPRFHDHIIQDDEGYRRITNYINDNPSKWDRDLNREGNVSESIIDYHRCVNFLRFKEDNYLAK